MAEILTFVAPTSPRPVPGRAGFRTGMVTGRTPNPAACPGAFLVETAVGFDRACADLGLAAMPRRALVGEIETNLLRFAALASASAAPATVRGRRSDMRGFVAWATVAGIDPLASPAAMSRAIEDYLLFLGESHAPASLARVGSTLTLFAEGIGLAAPGARVRKRLAIGAARRQACRPHAQSSRGVSRGTSEKSRLSPADLAAMRRHLATAPGIPKGVRLRDTAILLVFEDLLARRSEVAGLTLADVDLGPVPMLFIARSKTDQEGKGVWCGIGEETRAALGAWIDFARLEASAPTTPLFQALTRAGGLCRSCAASATSLDPGSLNRLVQRQAAAAGVGSVAHVAAPATAHAIRRGVARALWDAGIDDRAIMELGRWEDEATMRGYVGLPARRGGASGLLAGSAP